MAEQSLIGNDVAAYIEYNLTRNRIPHFARKFFKAGDVSGLAGAINVTYGALVYDQVNREANAHAILKKEMWERSGHRVTTSNPTVKGYGGADPGTVGAVVDINPDELDSIPGFLHTPFDMTMDAGFRAMHDDGLDVWEWKLAVMRDVHAQLLNEELLKNAEYEAAIGGGGATTDAKNDTTASATGRGLETLDRLIAADAEEDDLGGAGSGWFDVFEGQVDRDSAVTYDSVIVKPDGTKTGFTTDDPFQVTGLDQLIDDTEDNGADPSAHVFLTGRQTRRSFYNELQSAGRYDLTSIQAKLDMGGLSVSATHPGRDITFTIRAYSDRPFVVDKNVPKEGVSATPTGRPHVYLIDQRHLFLKTGFPTIYVDTDNPVIRGQFDTKALYLTAEQLMSTRFNTSGKLRAIA